MTEHLEQWFRVSRLAYPVPAHATRLPATLGGVAFVGLVLLFITGIGLAQFVVPLPDQAHESIQATARSPVAAYLRALHYWLAQAVVIVLLAHLGRAFLVGAYQPPRMATWLVGVGLFLTAVFGSYFSGTVLKGDQEGLEALQHYTELVRQLGLGALLGPAFPGAPLLLRVYVLHLVVFPLVIIGLVALHFYLINTFNLAPLPWGGNPTRTAVPPEEMTATLRDVMRRILQYSAVSYTGVALLAFVVPAPLGPQAVGASLGVKPPWAFLWLYALESLFGFSWLLWGLVGLAGALVILPWFDRSPSRHPRDRKAVLAIIGVVAMGLLLLSLYAWWAPEEVHLDHLEHHQP